MVEQLFQVVIQLWMWLVLVVATTYRNESGLFEVPTNIPIDTSTLLLQNNQISYFPSEDLQYLTELQILVLTLNRLEKFPDVRPFAATITSLQLSGNQISSVPTEYLEGVTSLESLYLDNNLITVFPDLDPVKTSLTWLDLKLNQIADVPSGSFLGFTKLTSLSLDSNYITSVPNTCSSEFWERLLSSSILILNPFTCDCKAQHLYTVDSPMTNNMRCTNPITFFGLKMKDDLTLGNLTCKGSAGPESTFREISMTRIKQNFYCSHPPVVARIVTDSLSKCVSLCLETSSCYYINTLTLDNGDVICDITDTSATDSVVEPMGTENSGGWTYYSSL